MKKIGLIGLIGFIGLMGSVRAQFGDYGVKVGLGFATIDDDLGTKSPILGATVGGYINYTFLQSKSVLAETFFLQTGLSLNRRGSKFEEVRENGTDMSIRTGFAHAYYLQLPILACVHYELPIRQPGHVVGLFVGPAFSYGLFGRYSDRMVHPGYSDVNTNYDLDFNGSAEDRKVFNHYERFDSSALIGITYEYKHFTVSFYIDRGFIAVSEGPDILRIIESSQSGNKPDKIPDGNNKAYMLSVSYSLGSFIKEKIQ